MKLRRQLLPLLTFLLLLFVLLLTGCNNGSEIEETNETEPATEEASNDNTDGTSDAEPTIVLATATVAPEPTEVAPEPIETLEEPSAESTPLATATTDSAATVEPTTMPEATEVLELIPTPELKAFVTPKSRTLWRAGSGELFIRFDNGIKNFQYYLYVPEHWYGFFEMRQDTEDVFLFNYIGNPDMKREVFRVQAFPEHIWPEKKAAGDPGIEFYSLRNVTFVYYAASENPFEGEEAELFQQMIDDVPEIIHQELEIVSRRFNKE